MFTARKKIAKDKGAEPDAFEESVAQVCVALVQGTTVFWGSQVAGIAAACAATGGMEV